MIYLLVHLFNVSRLLDCKSLEGRDFNPFPHGCIPRAWICVWHRVRPLNMCSCSPVPGTLQVCSYLALSRSCKVGHMMPLYKDEEAERIVSQTGQYDKVREGQIWDLNQPHLLLKLSLHYKIMFPKAHTSPQSFQDLCFNSKEMEHQSDRERQRYRNRKRKRNKE